MKILALSDTHSNYFNHTQEYYDLIIHAGDLQVYDNISDLHRFIKWCNSFNAKYKICIAGNHDKFIYESNNLCRQIFKENNIIYLENSMIEIENIKIYGSPITPTFLNWYFMADRGEAIKRYWDMIPYNLDILITHGPPKSILDYTSFLYKNQNNHVGCEELLKAVERVKPCYHLFGHLHSANGVFKNNYTTFINVSVLDDDYKMKFEPKVFEI